MIIAYSSIIQWLLGSNGWVILISYQNCIWLLFKNLHHHGDPVTRIYSNYFYQKFTTKNFTSFLMYIGLHGYLPSLSTHSKGRLPKCAWVHSLDLICPSKYNYIVHWHVSCFFSGYIKEGSNTTIVCMHSAGCLIFNSKMVPKCLHLCVPHYFLEWLYTQ